MNKHLQELVSALIRWCCQKPKKKTPATPQVRQTYTLAANTGFISVTGQDAEISYTPHEATEYTVPAETGSIGVVGHDAGVGSGTYFVPAATGSIAVNGQDATIKVARRVAAAGGSVGVNGQAAAITRGYRVAAEAGSVGVDGKAAALSYAATATDPESILDAGLSTVYHLKETAGPRSALTKSLPADQASLPIGSFYASGELRIQGAATFANWDFSGIQVFVDGNITVTFNDCKFATNSASPTEPLMQGTLTAGLPHTIMNYCTVDLWRDVAVYHGGGRSFRFTQGSWTANYCRFTRISGDITNWDGPGSMSMSYCYTESPSQNAYIDPVDASKHDHCELVNCSGGSVLIDHCYMDCSVGGSLTSTANTAGIFLLQPRNSALTFTMSNCIADIGDLDAFYGMQMSDNNFALDATFTNNVWQAPGGGSGYFLDTSASGHVRGSGNIDLNTSAALPSPVNT